jgi:cellulose synthase/poly-beta-1,6-N-acetylglucosamine synthase-like glycosyltransferase
MTLGTALAFGCGTVLAAITLPGAVELAIVTAGCLFPARRGQAGSRSLKTAVVIPAHDEERLIERCVSSVKRSAAASSADVVVIADNCSDRTAELARSSGARVLVREHATERGKGFALRFAFSLLAAEGFEAFLIVDADSVVSQNFVPESHARLSAGADAVQCRYIVANAEETVRTRLMDLALTAFNVVRPLGRNRLGLSAGIFGNGFGLLRKTLEAVPYEARSVVEDLEYHLMLVRSGKSVDFLDSATVWGDMPISDEAARSQRSRWEGGRLRMVRDFAPGLMRDLLMGTPRLLEPVAELLSLPLAYAALAAFFLIANPVLLFRTLGVLELGLIAWHVGAAVALSDRPGANLRALASAPLYILWKLSAIRTTLASARTGAEWVRTQR